MEPVSYDRDREHLKLLSIFHYVAGSFLTLGGLISVAMLYQYLRMLAGHQAEMPREGLLAFTETLMWMVVLAAVALGIGTLVSGWLISQRHSRTFSIVIAALMCLWFPFGTLVGVCTIMVLCRQSVVQLYDSIGAGGEVR